MKSHKAIFISHAWGGISDEILAQLVKRLKDENIAYILDKRDLAYRQSIQDFMVELGKADMVIIILSNKYLKSEYCMFELIQIYKNANLRERIFPIVLDEVKISSSADRLDLVRYWEIQLTELQNKIKELNSLTFIEGITEDLNLYSEIRNNIARLTQILRDINTLNIQIHQESDYQYLISAIKKRINPEEAEKIIPPPLPRSTIKLPGDAPASADQTAEIKQKEEGLKASVPISEQTIKEEVVKSQTENLTPGNTSIEKTSPEKQKAQKPKPEKPKSDKAKIAKAKVIESKIDQPKVTEPRPIKKIVVRQKVTAADLDQLIESNAKHERKKSTVLTPFNLALAGVVLLLIVGSFITWKILSAPKDDLIYTIPDGTDPDSVGSMFYRYLGGVMRDTTGLGNLHDFQYPASENDPIILTYPEDYDEQEDPFITYEKPGSSKESTGTKKQTTTSTQPTYDDQKNYEVIRIPTSTFENAPETESDETADHISSPIEEDHPVVSRPLQSASILRGTKLSAKISSTLSSDDNLKLPSRVNFALNRPVYHGSSIAISAGSIVVAKVIRMKRSDHRRKGSIDLVFEYLIAPDGQRIPLKSDEMHLEAKGDQPYQITPNMNFEFETSSNVQIKY